MRKESTIKRKPSSVTELRDWLKSTIKRKTTEPAFEEIDLEEMKEEKEEKKEEKRRRKESKYRRSKSFHQGPLPTSIENSYTEHTFTIEQLADTFPLSRIHPENPELSQGMNLEEVFVRLGQDGRNEVRSTDDSRGLWLYVKQFAESFRMLLLATAVVCAVSWMLDPTQPFELSLAFSLLAVLMAICALSAWQEKTAKKEVRGFQSMLPDLCWVVRGSKQKYMEPEGLVVGDIVWLKPGNRVPADIRLLHTASLQLDTSWISGHADRLPFTTATAPKGSTALQAQNVAFAGCSVAEGEALGIVIRTGNDTMFGQLVRLSAKTNTVHSRLNDDRSIFTKYVCIVSVILAVCTLLVGLALSPLPDFTTIFINGFLVVIIANVPQGLPVTVTSQLIIVARRLSKKKLFMKKLEVAETLGTTSVLLCDKTGVLTDHAITLTDLWIDKKSDNVTHLLERSAKIYLSDDSSEEGFNGLKPMDRLLSAMSVCNRAQVEQTAKLNETFHNNTAKVTWTTKVSPEPHFPHRSGPPATANQTITGQPTEVAILQFVEKFSSVLKLREFYDVVFEVPFNKRRRWNIVVARDWDDVEFDEEDGDITYTIFVKGAPEEVFSRCSHIATTDGDVAVNSETAALFQKDYLSCARRGRSCLGFAMSTFEATAGTRFSEQKENFPKKGFTYLGTVGLYDPPRAGISQEIKRAREAGIRLHMVTGDHPHSAAAMAEQIGFGDEPTVILGDMLSSLSRSEWTELLSMQHVVFARMRPQDKLLVVKECESRGLVTAVTGDGVLDAPVLNEAHVGIAVEAIGSVFAKEAADCVLLSGGLSQILDGILAGRLLFENLKKTLAYTLSHLVPELWSVLLTFLAGMPLGLTSIQVITIDLITEIPPAIALVFERPERDLMKKKPRESAKRLVSRGLLAYAYIFAGTIISIGCAVAYFSVFWYYGVPISSLVYSVNDHWTATSANITTRDGGWLTGVEQQRIKAEASGAWHITLVGSQALHVWQCSTRRASVFSRLPANPMMLAAVLTELILLNVFVYLPGVNWIIGASHPPLFVWLFPLAVGIVLLVFNEVRKYFIRHQSEDSIYLKIFKW